MQQEPTPSPVEQDNLEDAVVLGVMVNTKDQRIWSFEEIEREMGRDPIDSLNRLYGGGLIHRLDGKRFFWATRAALMADEIAI
jgi:hypothetical protein